MLKTGLRLWLLVCILICLVGSVGCSGKKGIVVKGKVVLPAGVQLDKNDSVSVRIVPESKDKSGKGGASAGVNVSDLTFTLKDVAPGKYKAGATFSTYGSTKQHEAEFKKLNEKYDPEGSSPLTYEVTSDSEQSITIDLAAGKVTKQ